MPSDNKKEKRKSERNPYAGSIMDRVFKATSAMRDIRSDVSFFEGISHWKIENAE